MTHMKFVAENGDQYIFIGKSKKAIIDDTKGGTEFGGEKFIDIKEVSIKEVIDLKNYNKAAAAIISGSPSYLITIISSKNKKQSDSN